MLNQSDIDSIKACNCRGYFSGVVTSLNPVLVNCGAVGDDCIVIITNEGKRAVGFALTNTENVDNNKWFTFVEPDLKDCKVWDKVQVGDIAFDLQYDCESCYKIYRNYYSPNNIES